MRLHPTNGPGGPATVVLAAALGAGVLAGTAPAADAEPGGRPVTYHGIRLHAPRGWPVIDLDAHPATCARLDRHAIYLGTPGPEAACPPHIHGRTETVSLRPMGTAGPTARVRHTGVPHAVPRGAAHQASWALEAAGLRLTVTYGRRPGVVDHVLAGMRVTGAARHSRAPRVPESATDAVQVPGTASGYGFDTCQAPSARTMRTWRSSSHFRTIGVYLGGGDLGCPQQPNLSASWVADRQEHGWHVLPIYVGRQAPCSGEPYRITDPDSQGAADADDAADRAAHYGMAEGSIIVDDMEFYRRGGSCSTAVLSYLSAWTTRLHERGYRSGVYSSLSAAITDLVQARPGNRYQVPGTIVFADWDGHATVTDGAIPSDYWAPHHRMKQYRGGHNETHGGVTLNIDSDFADIT